MNSIAEQRSPCRLAEQAEISDSQRLAAICGAGKRNRANRSGRRPGLPGCLVTPVCGPGRPSSTTKAAKCRYPGLRVADIGEGAERDLQPSGPQLGADIAALAAVEEMHMRVVGDPRGDFLVGRPV